MLQFHLSEETESLINGLFDKQAEKCEEISDRLENEDIDELLKEAFAKRKPRDIDKIIANVKKVAQLNKPTKPYRKPNTRGSRHNHQETLQKNSFKKE